MVCGGTGELSSSSSSGAEGWPSDMHASPFKASLTTTRNTCCLMAFLFSSAYRFRQLPNSSRVVAHFFSSNRLQCVVICSLLITAVFASPAVTDAENAVASLSHPHGAQYSFHLSESSVADTVGAFHHIPVRGACCAGQLMSRHQHARRCTSAKAHTLAACP